MDVIEVKGLKKSFGSLQVLKGIDLKAQKKQVISILGSSGSGKSTLLRCLNFLELPDQAELSYFSKPLELKKNSQGQLEPKNPKDLLSLRARIAMVFQQFNLWPHMSILKNVTLAPRKVLGLSEKEALERAESYLSKVGVWEKKDEYPGKLSGGQKQRVAIARALAMEPEVLLFDEPTSALDPELVGEVLKVMKGLAEENRTMLVVTHEMNFARDVSNKIVFLENGEISAQGSPQELFEDSVSPRFKEFISSVY